MNDKRSSSKTKSSTQNRLKNKKDDEKKKKPRTDNKENKEKEKKVKRVRTPSPLPPSPHVEEEENYEEDFEDYSDDFESDDADAGEEDMKEEERAVKPVDKVSSPRKEAVDTHAIEVEESPMLRRLQSRQGGRESMPAPARQESPKVPQQITSTERKISFTGAQNINIPEMTESDRRFQKLKDIITLTSTTIHIMDQPPVKDYDFYMEMFGDSSKAQISTQTGDDNMAEEAQTEEPNVENKWTQHPPQDDFGFGSDRIDNSDHLHEQDTDMNIFKDNHLQNERLKTFVETAGEIVITMVCGKHKTGDYLVMRNRSELAFSAGYNTLHMGPVASKYNASSLSRNPRDDNLLLVSFCVQESVAGDLEKKSLLAEFVLSVVAPPQRLFIADGEISCTSYAPDGSALFAGAKDGSTSVWDLLEVSESTSSLPWLDSKDDIPLRLPAFDTSFMAAALSSRDNAAIISVQAAAKEGGDVQLACLDEAGCLSIWQTVRDESAAGAAPPGRRPQARLSLALAALIRPDPVIAHTRSRPTFLLATSLAALPSDPLRFLVGTDSGLLMNMTRAKSSAYHGPRLYKANMHVFGEVLCIRFSPFDKTVFASGLSTGALALYRLGQSAPLLVLTPPHSSRQPVTSIEWSPTCSSALYSVHAGRRLLTWDVSVGRAPLAVCDLTSLPAAIAASLAWQEKAVDESAPAIAYMAFALENGEVQVHALEPMRERQTGALVSMIQRLDGGTL